MQKLQKILINFCAQTKNDTVVPPNSRVSLFPNFLIREKVFVTIPLFSRKPKFIIRDFFLFIFYRNLVNFPVKFFSALSNQAFF